MIKGCIAMNWVGDGVGEGKKRVQDTVSSTKMVPLASATRERDSKTENRKRKFRRENDGPVWDILNSTDNLLLVS